VVAHGYTGQERDTTTGLYYYGARYYDPAAMRFISADSVIPSYGDPQAYNHYAYTRGNPVKNIDPTGHVTISADSTTLFMPNFPRGPMFRLPTPPGWKDANSSNWDSHWYDIPVYFPLTNAASLMDGIINKPTPGSPRPATVGGTFNDATPAGPAAAWSGLMRGLSYGQYDDSGKISPVLSYLTSDLLTGQPLVVNVGLPGHLLQGYVVRYTQQLDTGALVHNVGEGGGFLQSDYSGFLSGWINEQWTSQTNSIEPSSGFPSPFLSSEPIFDFDF
jgi:RHS repeat-associated protein